MFRAIFLVLVLISQYADAQNAKAECGGYLENVAVDFETDADGNLLKAGDVPKSLPGGIHRIIGFKTPRGDANPGNDAMIFDTNNPTGGDRDLRRRWWGNVLILSENGDRNDPKANRRGGSVRFVFKRPVWVIHKFNNCDWVA